jgi:hypothetical protein
MRKMIATVVALAALGAVAGTAAADVPNPIVTNTVVASGHYTTECVTPASFGVFYSSAAARYHDGCTASQPCPFRSGTRVVSSCTVMSHTVLFQVEPFGGYMTSQNARLRVYNRDAAQDSWHHDVSCYRYFSCATDDTVTASPGQWVTVQCNGVHYASAPKWYSNSCKLDMTY